jgi:F-type H+-transporting ATPase subunit b
MSGEGGHWVSGARSSLLRALGAAVAFASALPCAAALWAAEEAGEQHGDPWLDLLWKAVNFAALVALLWYFLRKPVGKALRGAAARVKATVDEARQNASDMERRYRDQRRNLENLKAALERLREEARRETQAETERLMKDAQAAADRMSGQIEKQVQQARTRALQSLREELADEAVKQAEALIRQRLDDATRRRLLDTQIARQERLS